MVLSGAANVAVQAISDDLRFSGCLVTKSADLTAQNATSGLTQTFNTETYDTDGWHESVTNPTRLTVPAGLGINYVVLRGQVGTSLDGADSGRTLTVLKNGSAMDPGVFMIHEDGGTLARIQVESYPVPVVDGDYFELNFTTETDNSITITANRTWFSIERAG
jgi:hypothetical protein